MNYAKQLFNDYENKITWNSNPIITANEIYKALKKDERQCGNKKELEIAKSDLDKLGIDYTGLTPNKIYLKHQSEFVNAFYMIIKGIEF